MSNDKIDAVLKRLMVLGGAVPVVTAEEYVFKQMIRQYPAEVLYEIQDYFMYAYSPVKMGVFYMEMKRRFPAYTPPPGWSFTNQNKMKLSDLSRAANIQPPHFTGIAANLKYKFCQN